MLWNKKTKQMKGKLDGCKLKQIVLTLNKVINIGFIKKTTLNKTCKSKREFSNRLSSQKAPQAEQITNAMTLRHEQAWHKEQQ